MANPPRIRKRVHPIRRAPDGSAFENCDKCGVSVPISLADMHECETETKKTVKRFKGTISKQHNIGGQSHRDEPRSPFVFFMEDFMNSCKNGKMVDVDRKGFETWKKMPNKEREPYVTKAQKVNSAYVESLIQEISDSFEVDEEADSAMVGKFDPMYEDCGYNDCFDDSFNTFRKFESFNTWELEIVKSWT